MYTTHIRDVSGGQRRASNLLELELQTVVSYRVESPGDPALGTFVTLEILEVNKTCFQAGQSCFVSQACRSRLYDFHVQLCLSLHLSSSPTNGIYVCRESNLGPLEEKPVLFLTTTEPSSLWPSEAL